MTRAKKVEAALRSRGMRYCVGAIDDNPATPGEVVLWINGTGHPVYTVREALKIVRRFAEEILP